jgi:hypothetical protein
MISPHKAALCRGAREIHHPVIEKGLKHASINDNCVMMSASLAPYQILKGALASRIPMMMQLF